MRSTISWSKAFMWVRNGPRRGAAVDELDDGRLDLDVALVVEGLPDGAQRRGLGAHHVAGLLAHDEVGVALPDPALLRELLVQHRQRAQRLATPSPSASP